VLPDEARLVAAALVSLITAAALTPLALRLAVWAEFYDFPVGYKAHAAPTAYLGGAAVLSGFVVAAVLFAEGATRFAPILVCAVGLGALGTLDDRRTVRPSHRIVAEVVAAAVLWRSGLGWSFLASGFEEFVLTAVWLVAFTNAFNLMDNMDGAAGTVASACAAGLAVQSLAQGDAVLAALALAVAGACLGFLPYNLRAGAPARIFLGDGGSMPIGFILAATAINIPTDRQLGWPTLLISAMLLALPVLDTLLVVISRTRRRVSIVTAGRDHLTHRLHTRFASARLVAAALAVTQIVVSFVAILAAEGGRTTIITTALGLLALGAGIVAVLEGPAWTVRQRSQLREP
jgi:UDP-GlcNAc:undecaprenyl-phosphate GlcNAc-1-phosphate transferase